MEKKKTSRIKKLIERVKKFRVKKYGKFLPLLYISILVLGSAITGLFIYFPTLYKCGVVLGLEMCQPTGTYIMMTASAPGYLIGGNLLKLHPTVTLAGSILVVFVTSLLFYYAIGWVIDKWRKHELEPIKTILVTAIILCLFLLLALS